MKKRCALCGEEKAVDEFHRGNGGMGRAGRCKPCRKSTRNRSLELHHLSAERYAEILASQSGHCYFCDRSVGLVVDHDHACCPGPRSCGECVRGLLCRVHNTAVWNFGDDLTGALRLVAYHLASDIPSTVETVVCQPKEHTHRGSE